MNVVILDTVTGNKTPSQGYDGYWWSEGNGSCDCNRAIYSGVQIDTEGVCLGCKRFLIVESDNPEYSLAELNQGYPSELLKAHGIPT